MSFQNSAIIVRDDGKYPEDALVVDGYDNQGHLLAHPLGGGFQISIPLTEHFRFDGVPDEEKTPIFTRTQFALEGTEGTFAAWTDGTDWNGWAMPRFEFADAQLLIAALGKDVSKYDATADAFITTMQGGDEETWPAEIIHLPDGGTVKVYAIGAGSWIWEEADSP